MNAEPSFETVLLERLRVGVQQAVSGELAHSVEVEAYADHITNSMIYQLTAHVLAERLPTETDRQAIPLSYDVPATWWQHWKADHPRAAKRLRLKPVRMETHTRTVHTAVDISRYWTYPEAKRLHTDFGGPYRAMVVQPFRWDLGVR